MVQKILQDAIDKASGKPTKPEPKPETKPTPPPETGMEALHRVLQPNAKVIAKFNLKKAKVQKPLAGPTRESQNMNVPSLQFMPSLEEITYRQDTKKLEGKIRELHADGYDVEPMYKTLQARYQKLRTFDKAHKAPKQADVDESNPFSESKISAENQFRKSSSKAFEGLPFTEEAYNEARDQNLKSVRTKEGDALGISIANGWVAKRMKSNGSHLGPTDEQNEIKQAQIGGLGPGQRSHNNEKWRTIDDFVKNVGAGPGQLYTDLTGLTEEDAPYAHKALDVIGGILSTPFVVAGQANYVRKNPIQAIKNLPEVGGKFLNSVNILDPSIDGPERFGRILNLILTVDGAQHGLKRLGFKPKAVEILGRKFGVSPKKSLEMAEKAKPVSLPSTLEDIDPANVNWKNFPPTQDAPYELPESTDNVKFKGKKTKGAPKPTEAEGIYKNPDGTIEVDYGNVPDHQPTQPPTIFRHPDGSLEVIHGEIPYDQSKPFQAHVYDHESVTPEMKDALSVVSKMRDGVGNTIDTALKLKALGADPDHFESAGLGEINPKAHEALGLVHLPDEALKIVADGEVHESVGSKVGYSDLSDAAKTALMHFFKDHPFDDSDVDGLIEAAKNEKLNETPNGPRFSKTLTPVTNTGQPSTTGGVVPGNSETSPGRLGQDSEHGSSVEPDDAGLSPSSSDSSDSSDGTSGQRPGQPGNAGQQSSGQPGRQRRGQQQLDELEPSSENGTQDPAQPFRVETEPHRADADVPTSPSDKGFEPPSGTWRKIHDQINKIFNPAGRSEQAGMIADLFRQMNGRIHHGSIKFQLAFRDLRKAFSKVDAAQSIQMYSEAETGNPTSPLAVQLHELTRAFLDPLRDQITKETGKLDEYIENYLPHLFKQKKVGFRMRDLFTKGKGNLKGSEQFLKHRKYDGTISDVLLANPHLEPLFSNPVDMVQAVHYQMTKFLEFSKLEKELWDKEIPVFVQPGEEVPVGYSKVNDRAFRVSQPNRIHTHEYVNSKLYRGLVTFADSLGLPVMKWNLDRGELGRYDGTSIKTANFAPEEALSHEIGHAIEDKYGFDSFLRKFSSSNQKTFDAEFEKLSKEREGASKDQGFQSYVRDRDEQLSTLIQAYIHNRPLAKKLAPLSVKALEAFIKSNPALKPLTKLEPGLEFEGKSVIVQGKGKMYHGEYYVPDDVAQVINNYLSPGIEFEGVKALQKLNRNLNMAQLALPVFHLGMTYGNIAATEFSLGLKKIADNLFNPKMWIKGTGQMVKGAFPVLTQAEYMKRGAEIRTAYIEGYSDPRIGKIVDGIISANGRVQADLNHTNLAVQAFKDALSSKKFATSALKLPAAAAEWFAKPVMEYGVPYAKLTAFGKIFEYELGKIDNPTDEQIRRTASRAWDNVDNRFGQLVYDNLFWDNRAKNLMMLSTRSVGWNLGSAREFGGAVGDVVKGRGFSQRMAFATSLPIIVGLNGMLINYLLTGSTPKAPIDAYFPRTGKKNADGSDQRITLPSYMKDWFGIAHDPLKTIGDKSGPAISEIIDQLQNRDYYGNELASPDDPFWKRDVDRGMAVLKQFMPFILQNIGDEIRTNGITARGIALKTLASPAPGYIGKSPALQTAGERLAATIPNGNRTTATMDLARGKSQVVSMLRNGETEKANAKMKELKLTDDQKDAIRDRASVSGLVWTTKKLGLKDALAVYKVADEKERAEIKEIILDKLDNAADKLAPEDFDKFQKTWDLLNKPK